MAYLSSTLNKLRFEARQQLDSRLTKAYLDIFRELADRTRYRAYSVGEFYVDHKGEADLQKVNVVVRIDVDSGFHLSIPLARALVFFGVRATHFFLTHPERYYDIWGSGVPQQVRNLGHEIGLHSDHYYEQLTTGENGLSKLKEDIRRLGDESGGPIRGMCFHGHPEINALGHTNWELTKNLPSSELGLDYHDGLQSCYIAEGVNHWAPACDIRMTDFLGWPKEWGWNLYPDLPLRQLREANRGQVVHMAFHTMSAFRYWKDWTAEFGERPLPRPSPVRFCWRAIQVRQRNRRSSRPSLKKRIFFGVVHISTIVLTKGLGQFWPKPKTPEPDTTWTTGRERIFSLGIQYWRDQLEKLEMTAPNGVVLEVGSGNGQWLLAYAQDSALVIGIEPSDEIRQFSQRKIQEFKDLADRIEVLKGTAESIPLPDGSVDALLCAGLFMFTQKEQALAEMARVLKLGGRLCLTANGLGYFWMYVFNGLRYRSTEKMRYGLLGIGATCLKWWKGTELPFPKAVSEKEMSRRLARHGFRLLRSHLWLPQNLYPPKHLGYPTNFAFIARKDSNTSLVGLSTPGPSE